MAIGEKIKECRLYRNMTQSELVGDRITRNMLSAIEGGKATPSLETILYLAERLDIPVGFLLSEQNDLAFYIKNQQMPEIKSLLSSKKFQECAKRIAELDFLDDELAYILATCHFEMAVSYAKNGAFDSASESIRLCGEYSSKTAYDTSRYELILPLYAAFVKNINAPLLEFDGNTFYECMLSVSDYEFFRYLECDFDFPYKNSQFKLHMQAKKLIKERRYTDAIGILLQIEAHKHKFEYNIYLMFGVYADLDNCYKQICDFENAYRYSSKRLSLIEGFST